jgi:glucose-1-phosphate adenylyltransferase
MSQLTNSTLGLLLAGGVGERLFPLTRHRAKPAVPFGGNYRIIDVTLSNCINSGLRRLFVFTQYKSLSLNRHIRNGWYNIVAKDLDEFIEIVPPQKRVGEDWYLGTADAVWQNIYTINGVSGIKFVLVLPGDHIYKMNYHRMVKHHVDSDADVTIGAIEVPIEDSDRYGIMRVDESGRVRDFVEKPVVAEPLPGNPRKTLASMGIYVFSKKLLLEVLDADARNPSSTHDFGKDILGMMLDKYSVSAHHFVDENKKEAQYWRDVGTIDSYYDANMDLVEVSPLFNLYDKEWPIRTHQRQYPPAKFVFADEGARMGIGVDSIISSGCILSGGRVQNSVLSPDVRVNSYSVISNSIVFSHCDIGRNCRIRKAIIDRDVHLPEGTVIGYDPEDDRKRYLVTDSGIVVVSQDYTSGGKP